jgi:hypothetical protein
MKKQSVLRGYEGKKKEAERWLTLNKFDANGDSIPFRTIKKAREAGATKATPMFTRK